MFHEHPNGRMIEIKSHDVNFTENDFLSIIEIKKTYLYELEEVYVHTKAS